MSEGIGGIFSSAFISSSLNISSLQPLSPRWRLYVIPHFSAFPAHCRVNPYQFKPHVSLGTVFSVPPSRARGSFLRMPVPPSCWTLSPQSPTDVRALAHDLILLVSSEALIVIGAPSIFAHLSERINILSKYYSNS